MQKGSAVGRRSGILSAASRRRGRQLSGSLVASILGQSCGHSVTEERVDTQFSLLKFDSRRVRESVVQRNR